VVELFPLLSLPARRVFWLSALDFGCGFAALRLCVKIPARRRLTAWFGLRAAS